MADTATEHISVAAPPERCFDVAADLERYPEWAADIKEIEVKERDDLGRPTPGHLPGRRLRPQHELHAGLRLRRGAARPGLEADPGRHHHQARRQLRLRPGRGRRHRRHVPPRGGAARAHPRFHQDAGHEPHHGDGHARAEGAGRVDLVSPDGGPPAAAGVTYGVDIGGTKVLGVALGPDDGIVAEARVPTPRGKREIVGQPRRRGGGAGRGRPRPGARRRRAPRPRRRRRARHGRPPGPPVLRAEPAPGPRGRLDGAHRRPPARARRAHRERRQLRRAGRAPPRARPVATATS